MATVTNATLDLLRPEAALAAAKSGDDDNDDDLEALRQAALASMKPKNVYKVHQHPFRANLLTIVPIEEPEEHTQLPRDAVALSRDAGSSKFHRYESHGEEDSESEVEVEVETEVEVTDSDEDAACHDPKTVASDEQTENKKDDLDDVLHVDCREEVDEFSKFLNEFETELNDNSGHAKDKKRQASSKVKKTVKKTVIRVLKKSNVYFDKAAHTHSRSSRRPRRSESGSPRGPRTRSRSPRYYRSPPDYRRFSRSPYKSPSRRCSPPSRSRRRSQSRYHSRSPSSSSRRVRTSQSGRAESAGPREQQANQAQPRFRINEQAISSLEASAKSKSLPPSQRCQPRCSRNGQSPLAQSQDTKADAQADIELEQRLKRLPTPERERLLARKRKFEMKDPVSVTAEKKLIVLKKEEDDNHKNRQSQSSVSVGRKAGAMCVKRLASADEAISLSVEDTLDMFDDEKKLSLPRKYPARSEEGSAGATHVDDIADLRLQLHRKRQMKHDQDFLENAVIEFSDDDKDDNDGMDVTHHQRYYDTRVRSESVTVSRDGHVSRVVKPRGQDDGMMPATRTVLLSSASRDSGNVALANHKTGIRPSVLARLGQQIHDVQEKSPDVTRGEQEVRRSDDESRVPRKRPSSGNDQSSAKSLAKDETKGSKKEKKKDKKEKKKLKKEKRKKHSKGSKARDSCESEKKRHSGEHSSDEELWEFFENLDRTKEASGGSSSRETRSDALPAHPRPQP